VNFAVLKRLPVVYVYENNQFSVCSPVSARQAGQNIFHTIAPHLMFTRKVNGNSVLEVYEAAKLAVDRARGGVGPSFIEGQTYRMRGHAGAGSDLHLGYRNAEELAAWEARCPVTFLRHLLLAESRISEETLAAMERTIDAEIEEAFRFARESPLPRREDLLRHLYRE